MVVFDTMRLERSEKLFTVVLLLLVILLCSPNAAENLDHMDGMKPEMADSYQRHGNILMTPEEVVKRRRKIEKTKCDPKGKYRTFSGVCNNFVHKNYGIAFQQMVRLLKPAYDDGHCKPRLFRRKKHPLPSARFVSSNCFTEEKDNANSLKDITLWLMQWAQFVDHDITGTLSESSNDSCSMMNPDGTHQDYDYCGPRFPIKIPSDDEHFSRPCMEFIRSLGSSGYATRQQINSVTAFLDASVVYGSTDIRAKYLRNGTGGLLKVEDLNMLPHAEGGECVIKAPAKSCFFAGEERVNVFPGLTSIHTILHRYHNVLATELAKINPSWDDETLFQEARKIVAAVIQRITYSDWLPKVLGEKAMKDFGLLDEYQYDLHVNPGIINSFATAAFRFGHSLLGENYKTMYSKNTHLKDMFFRPNYVMEESGKGVDKVVEGLLEYKSMRVDTCLPKSMMSHLFEKVGHPGLKKDVMSLNIQRGRDHGLPAYLPFHKACEYLRRVGKPRSYGLRPKTKGLNYLKKGWKRGIQPKIPKNMKPFRIPTCTKKVYRSIEDIDLMVGGLAEDPVEGGVVGDTFACIIATQFRRMRTGDRFFYETMDEVIGFTRDQLAEVKKISLSRLICDTTGLDEIQPDAFMMASDSNNVVPCDELPKPDLWEWKLQ